MDISQENYTGPLDLLLNLIERRNENIYNINISLIIDEYLSYVHQQSQNVDLETHSSFLIMCSRLLEIKSYMLLPPEEKEQESDPTKELISHLAQYKMFKSLSMKLHTMQDLSPYKDCFTRSSDIKKIQREIHKHRFYQDLQSFTADDLCQIFLSLMEAKKKRKDPVDKKNVEIKKDNAVFEKIMHEVKEYITDKSCCCFSEIPSVQKDKISKVMGFITILELSKQGNIYIQQDEKNDIFLKKI